MAANPSNDDAQIRFAITHKRLIQFVLRGHVRVAEPHDYGIRNGLVQLLVYQVAGASSSGKLPNWRWVVLGEMTEMRVLDRSFPGGRRSPSGRHARWDRLFLRVEEQ